MKEVSPEVPADFKCAISKKLMSDPVVAEDGETYEREAIENFFREKEKYESPITSPANGKPMGKTITSNNVLRRQINDFLSINPTLIQGMYFKQALYSSALTAVKNKDREGLHKVIEADRRILESSFEGQKKLLDIVCEIGTASLIALVIEELEKGVPSSQASSNVRRGVFGGGFGGVPQPEINPNMYMARLADNKKLELLLACSQNSETTESLKLLSKIFWPQDIAKKNFVTQQIAAGNLELAMLFIQNNIIGLEEEIEPSNKFRPLHVAVQYDKSEIAHQLVLLGADIYAKSAQGYTAKKMAKGKPYFSDFMKWHQEKSMEPLKVELRKLGEENHQLKENLKELERRFGLFAHAGVSSDQSPEKSTSTEKTPHVAQPGN